MCHNFLDRYKKGSWKVFLLAITLVMILSGCGLVQTVTPTPSPTVTPTADRASLVEETPSPERTSDAILLSTSTPASTATPGIISDVVSLIAEETGVNQVKFLGLSGEDWINLLISIVIFFVLVFFIARLLYALLERFFSRTKNKYTLHYLKLIRQQIRWLVAIFALQFGTVRLEFLTPEVKQWLDNLYSVFYVVTFTVMAWRLVDTVVAWYKNEIEPQQKELQAEDTVLLLGSRGARALILIISLTMLLSIYNINVNALIAALGIGGLAISLAAQDTLANVISGIIILFDKPFRVGDRIEIQGLGTWGDVVDIGLRSTRIRTRDNRLVIVPNNKIGTDQVINYSYPDPQYRIEMEIGIGYGQDIEMVRSLIQETVRKLEGVLKDKPVDALYVKMADSYMVFRIRWWIDSYVDTRRMFDRVNTALQIALDDAGISSPFPTYNIQVQGSDQESPQISGQEN